MVALESGRRVSKYTELILVGGRSVAALLLPLALESPRVFSNLEGPQN